MCNVLMSTNRHTECAVKDLVQSLQSRRVSTRQPSLIKQHQENTGTLRASACLCCPAYQGNTDLIPFTLRRLISHSLSFCLTLLLSARAALVSCALCWGIPANCLHIPTILFLLLKPGHHSFSHLQYCYETGNDTEIHTGWKSEMDILWNNMRSGYRILVHVPKHWFANNVRQAQGRRNGVTVNEYTQSI